ncbi:MAG: glycosyl hydrolase [Verrucomicrobiota bacterium]
MKSVRLILGVVLLSCGLAMAAETAWPPIGAEQKPWTRWWWLGSGVDAANLTKELEAFAAAGMGGVEICPIYGAVGYEDRDLDFLSKKWMAALAHTTREAKRLGLGVDLTTGTGWPFGGPQVGPDIASQGLFRIQEEVKGGGEWSLKLPGKVIVLRATREGGETVNLTELIKGDAVHWQAPASGSWTVLGLVAKTSIQKVKRAAPGGAGNVLDPYSEKAMNTYLASFDEAFRGFDAPWPRAQFHDSFEYYGAEWSSDLLVRFRQRNGYDLLGRLEDFLGAGDVAQRVRADWRATLSDMHRDYLSTWHDWANTHGGLTRNQAHGSPGNLLDHYAVADIPETEIFRHVEDAQIPVMALAASAAHANGRKLVSAESFTWLGEHFQVTPAALKEAADFLYLSGVNHLFFHGIPYSPNDAPWPGWLFYASTHMGPHGGLWREMPAFAGYLSRVQSVLQSGRPDSEVMLYFPFDDLGGDEETLGLYTIHNQNEWMHGTPFHRTAMELWHAGIPWDAVSASMLDKVKVADGRLVLGDVKAKVLVVPGAKWLSVPVLRRLLELERAGASVRFCGTLPEDVPGYGNLQENRVEFQKLKESLKPAVAEGELMELLQGLDVLPEPMYELGLRIVRRTTDDGWDYFVVNRSGKRVDAWVKLTRPVASAMLLDAAHADRHGLAEQQDGKIRLVLDAGESVVIRGFREKQDGKVYCYQVPAGDAIEVNGNWSVSFSDGGSEIPAGFETTQLGSWTTQNDPRALAFSGTGTYELAFDLPTVMEGHLLLDLGKVGETCRVSLNGQLLGSSFFPPHRFDVTGLIRKEGNTLAVEVTNLAANRIADLDRRKIDWKRFHEINFVNIDYKPFDASGWKPLESGLIGPVRLIPVR